MFLFDLLRNDAQRHPEKPAAIFPDARATFAELNERLEQEGIVSPANHAGKREILLERGA